MCISFHELSYSKQTTPHQHEYGTIALIPEDEQNHHLYNDTSQQTDVHSPFFYRQRQKVLQVCSLR